jgi:hypothetical protein
MPNNICCQTGVPKLFVLYNAMNGFALVAQVFNEWDPERSIYSNGSLLVTVEKLFGLYNEANGFGLVLAEVQYVRSGRLDH